MKLFLTESERLVHDFVFSDFLKEFFFTAFLNMNIKIVSKGNTTKISVNKSFDVIITKNTLQVFLAFTV